MSIIVSRGVCFYSFLLLVFILCWIGLYVKSFDIVWICTHWSGLLIAITLYLCSHFLRMLRLIMLTLHDRNKAFPLISAHILTAFPGSFFYFKMGEILRLTAFFYVYKWRQNALIVWLVERFGDVLVVSLFILGMYLFDVQMPHFMQITLAVFLLFSLIVVFGLFVITDIVVYLNRILILTSHTPRSLKLLRINHTLLDMRKNAYKLLDGRFFGFLFISVLIWAAEIIALIVFINQFMVENWSFAELFSLGSINSLSVGDLLKNATAFGFYQSSVLAALTLFYFIILRFIAHIKIMRS